MGKSGNQGWGKWVKFSKSMSSPTFVAPKQELPWTVGKDGGGGGPASPPGPSTARHEGQAPASG